MNPPEIEIAGRRIGAAHEPYVICELSGNHNGSLERALAMVDAAAATGADAIKLQTYTPDTLTIDHDGPTFRIEGGPWHGRTLYDLYGEAHTPWEWHAALFERARSLGVTVFSTPFDERAVEFLVELGSPALKIASFELVDHELIAAAAATGLPLVVSTGMANLEEIRRAVEVARAAGARELALLHCVSAYPAPLEEANLRTVAHLAETFGCVTGLSDHTLGTAAAVGAVALGAAVVEKHFTLARADGGPDAGFSLEPHEFRALVDDCKGVWRALGSADYRLGLAESGSTVFRRSLYVVRDVRAGELFTRENVRCIRPGFGLAPARLPEVLGRRARVDLPRGTPLSAEGVEGLADAPSARAVRP